MKTIIAGSRDIIDFELVKQAVTESGFEITEVVSGGARGVDRLGERWGVENNVPIKQFIPDWDANPKTAGFIRNGEMAEYGEALIAVTNGSRGTANMISQAEKKGLKVFVKEIGK